MQSLAKKVVATILGWQVRRLSRKNKIKVIAVAGSIGKTSTKLAIATVLSQKFKVRHQEGNYNDLITVPLVYFGHDFEENNELPILRNPLAWLKIFWQNEALLRRPYPYDVVVIELGSDGPGQMMPFKTYVSADIGVLTAIAPEHMEYFGNLEAVAKEEMSLAQLCKKLFYNADLVDKKYLLSAGPSMHAYDAKLASEYKAKTVGKAQQYSISAAIAIARALGLSEAQIKRGVRQVMPFAGRLQLLEGIRGSTIIDDSYNASPAAVKSSLNALYEFSASQRIAVLGNMNELGAHSEAAHLEIGEYCDAKKLDLVVTLGPDANKFTAPTAEARGCKVKTFDDPYAVGEYLKSAIKTGAAVLVKGSQNNVYAEEAIKLILANPDDKQRLVRQTEAWLKIKANNFKKAQ